VWGIVWGVKNWGEKMPALNRQKATYGKRTYPGVYFIMGKSISGEDERIYYIRYRKNGKMIDEKAGRQFLDKMTPAKAASMRARRMRGDEPTNQERRDAEIARKKAEAGKYTIDKLFNEYLKGRSKNKSYGVDKGRYEKYLKPVFEKKEPQDIAPLDVDRLRIKLQKKLSPQTVKHILNLFTWIVNFGVKKNLSKGLSFHVQKPTVDNIKTEDLSPEQLKNLLNAIDEAENIQIANIMKLVLFTGMRRGEIFKLKWPHIDFERGFINIVGPKGGIDQRIPLNSSARELLQSHPKTKSEFVFPGRGGKQRVTCQHGVNKIKKKAELPKDFRPLHGLRHFFASNLASSGKVDMYTLQKLLTHKSPIMTQRYSHLRDEALKQASELAGSITIEPVSSNDAKTNLHK
jgi:integrase